MKLILIRHGETHWNKEGRIQGLSDIDLNAVGLHQVQQLALSLKNNPVHEIYTSPLTRARKTAQIINQYHNVPLYTEPGLMEMDCGDFEGLSFKDLMACEKDFLGRWIADPGPVNMPHGESLIELQDRAWKVIERIVDKQETIIIVSHNFTIASILCRIKNISLSEFRTVCVDPASRTIIRFHNGSASIELFNDRDHLNCGNG